jgi:hypothetical protein
LIALLASRKAGFIPRFTSLSLVSRVITATRANLTATQQPALRCLPPSITMSDARKKLFGLFRSRSDAEKKPRDQIQVRTAICAVVILS